MIIITHPDGYTFKLVDKEYIKEYLTCHKWQNLSLNLDILFYQLQGLIYLNHPPLGIIRNY